MVGFFKVEDEDEDEEDEDEDEGFEEGGGEEGVGDEGPKGDQDTQEQRQSSGGGSGLALFGFGAGRHGVSQQAHCICMAHAHATCMARHMHGTAHAWHGMAHAWHGACMAWHMHGTRTCTCTSHAHAWHGMAREWHLNGVSQQARSQAAAALDAALQGHMAPDEPRARRPRTPWSRDEVAALELGVSTLGEGHWGVILERYAARFHSRRTDVDLKDKWRNMQRAPGH